MKTIFLAVLLIIAACLPACKPKLPNNIASVDTTASRPEDVFIDSNTTDTILIPQPTGFVNDFVGLFTQSQFNTLDSLVHGYEAKTSTEIAIVTLDTSFVSNQNFEAYTLQMARTWTVGKKEKNNGILIAIAPGLRRMRIQNGYGIENILSNEETKAIVDSVFIPQFKQGDYFEGTRQGILALIKKLDAK